jgi:hypothetical protein
MAMVKKKVMVSKGNNNNNYNNKDRDNNNNQDNSSNEDDDNDDDNDEEDKDGMAGVVSGFVCSGGISGSNCGGIGDGGFRGVQVVAVVGLAVADGGRDANVCVGGAAAAARPLARYLPRTSL